MTKRPFPKPDRSDFAPNFEKTAENDVLDLGWAEGQLSDGRPFRVESWCQDQMTMLTYFMSTKGLKHADDEFFRGLLVSEGLICFTESGQRHVSASKIKDASGNKMWSVNVVIGDEEETYAEDAFPLSSYTDTPPGPASG